MIMLFLHNISCTLNKRIRRPGKRCRWSSGRVYPTCPWWS